jgi:hypothetical protein
MRVAHLAIAAFMVLAIGAASVHSEVLSGTPGSAAGEGWQSSWLNLHHPSSFKKGQVVKLKLQGDAENVMVRFLPVGSAPDSADGIEGHIRKVPADGMLTITLERDHADVRQISVHAGREAWQRPLGGNNGTARLLSVESDSQ